MKNNCEEKREKKMSVLVLDTEIIIPITMEIEPTVKCCKSLLKCSETTFTVFKIEGTYYGFISDPEAMHTASPKVTVIGANERPYLCGNLVICRLNEEGSLLSLTNDDYNKLGHHLRQLSNETGAWLSVIDAEYIPMFLHDVRTLINAINMAMKVENGSIDG